MGLCNGGECDGLCCKYSERVILHEEEISFFLKSRIEIYMGKTYLNLSGGCEFLDGSKCSIYKNRPMECRVFWCGKIQREIFESKVDTEND